MSTKTTAPMFFAEAAQARRLASTFVDPETVKDLEAFALELEKHACDRELDYLLAPH